VAARGGANRYHRNQPVNFSRIQSRLLGETEAGGERSPRRKNRAAWG